MWLLICYVFLMAVGAVVSALLGLLVEDLWGSTIGLWAFLALYFASLWLGWVGAVRWTEPKQLAESPAVPVVQPAE